MVENSEQMNLPYNPKIEDDDDDWEIKVKNFDGLYDESILFTEKVDLENPTTQALQSLIYDETPDEIALNFKERGNEHLKRGKKWYKDAKKSYSEGIETEGVKDQKLMHDLYSNRAQVSIFLENYKDAIEDVDNALKFDPKNKKSIYRGAYATFHTKNFVKCLEFCKMDDFKELKEIESKVKVEMQKVEVKRVDPILEKIKERGFKLRKNDFEGQGNVKIEEDNTLSFKVVFLYDEFQMSDTIECFNEKDTFESHLRLMFPPEGPEIPWGSPQAKKLYYLKNLKIMDQKEIKLTDILENVLKDQGIPKNFLPIFHIVSTQAFKDYY